MDFSALTTRLRSLSQQQQQADEEAPPIELTDAQRQMVEAVTHRNQQEAVDRSAALLREDATLANTRDENGRPVLCLAAIQGNITLCLMLQQHGADAEARDGPSGLHWRQLMDAKNKVDDGLVGLQDAGFDVSFAKRSKSGRSSRSSSRSGSAHGSPRVERKKISKSAPSSPPNGLVRLREGLSSSPQRIASLLRRNASAAPAQPVYKPVALPDLIAALQQLQVEREALEGDDDNLPFSFGDKFVPTPAQMLMLEQQQKRTDNAMGALMEHIEAERRVLGPSVKK